jgi:hypothetical protein
MLMVNQLEVLESILVELNKLHLDLIKLKRPNSMLVNQLEVSESILVNLNKFHLDLIYKE